MTLNFKTHIVSHWNDDSMKKYFELSTRCVHQLNFGLSMSSLYVFWDYRSPMKQPPSNRHILLLDMFKYRILKQVLSAVETYSCVWPQRIDCVILSQKFSSSSISCYTKSDSVKCFWYPSCAGWDDKLASISCMVFDKRSLAKSTVTTDSIIGWTNNWFHLGILSHALRHFLFLWMNIVKW